MIPDTFVQPAAPPIDPKWFDRIARCATSLAVSIQSRKIRANELPIVLGILVRGLSDHTGLSVDDVLGMVRRAAVTSETPVSKPNEIPS
jgi:hypothetical protein